MTMAAAILAVACFGEATTAPRPTVEPTTSAAPHNASVLKLIAAVQKLTPPPTKPPPTRTDAEPATASPVPIIVPAVALESAKTSEPRSEQSPTPFPTIGATRTRTTATAAPTHTPKPDPRTTPNQSGPTGSLPYWAQDDVSEDEQPTVTALHALRYDNPELFDRIVAMPFLRQHHHHDATAVRSLSYIAYYDPQAAIRLIDTENLPEGITEDAAPRISMAYAETLYGGDPAHVMSPERLAITSRDITLASGSTATIAAAHPPNADASRALDAIEATVRRLTAYLGELPPTTRHFIVNYGGYIPSVAQGANMGPSITLQARHINDGGHKWLRHELSHHWFNSNQPWIDEGITQVLADITANDQPPSSVPNASGCAGSRISQISQGAHIVPPQCLYDLSHAVFADLHNSVGPEAFQSALISLYQLSKGRYGVPLSIGQIRKAFADHEAELGKALQDRY